MKKITYLGVLSLFIGSFCLAKAVVAPVATFIQPTPKQLIESNFGPDFVALSIAKCESGVEQFNKDGTVKRGVIDSQDVGVFQINEHYQLPTAEKLGIDIYTTQGNIEYAKYLYDTAGTSPWNASKGCWDK